MTQSQRIGIDSGKAKVVGLTQKNLMTVSYLIQELKYRMNCENMKVIVREWHQS